MCEKHHKLFLEGKCEAVCCWCLGLPDCLEEGSDKLKARIKSERDIIRFQQNPEDYEE